MAKQTIVKTGFNCFEVRENGITIAEFQTKVQAEEFVRVGQKNTQTKL